MKIDTPYLHEIYSLIESICIYHISYALYVYNWVCFPAGLMVKILPVSEENANSKFDP